jgi:DNA-binding GntR family transcriptional regulator
MAQELDTHENLGSATSVGVSERTRLMYERIVTAFVEHRIAPGTRLREERLAELFEVSRTQVRQVLQRLEHEGLVARQPRKGAVVIAPTLEDTRQIFQARRLIEPWLVERACRHCSAKNLASLRKIVRDEAHAHRINDRRTAVRLSGEFHRLLASLAGNQPLARTMDELTLRTCLAILANQAPLGSACRDDEHEQIVAAIEAGDVKKASRYMVEHLNHIEASLDSPRAPVRTDDLSILLEAMVPQPKRRSVRTR